MLLLLAFTDPALAQLPAEGRTSYSRDERIRIPFELRAGGPATKVVLYYSFDGGAWQEHESAKQGQKREFIFRADREGAYSFATMTYFSDGPSDPARKDQLTEQRRVVIDKTPPRVLSIRPSVSPEGSPGVEWDVADDFMDPKGVRLEFRWDGMGRYESIDRNVRFGPRDSRHWKMKPEDRMEVRVIATDRAGNVATSDPVWVSSRDAARAGDPVPRAPAAKGTSRENEIAPAGGARVLPASLHYLNTKSVNLNINAKVGPSGLQKASLYWTDEKGEWQKLKEDQGPLPAPQVNSPDKQRVIPVTFNFQAPKDGLYEFIIIIETHRETNRPIPKRGERGAIQVMVDTTKPELAITSTKVARNGDVGAVVDITWKASDTNIAPVPIKLEYKAIRPAGQGEMEEWKAITPDWIDNTGSHTWSAPTGEAYEFLVRVVCRDRAGNETKFETVKPVNTDLTSPMIEGVDVAPGRGGVPGGVSIPDMTGPISVGPGPKK
jgi:hypothetical protein